jgi:hypothetical protein
MGKKSENAGASYTATAYRKGGEVYRDPQFPQITVTATYSTDDMAKRATEALNMGLAVEIENHK